MLPLQLVGLALAGRVLLPKSGNYSLSGKKGQSYSLLSKNNVRYMPRPRTIHPPAKIPDPAAALQTLFKGVSGTVSQITNRITTQITEKFKTEDYNAVVKSFTPDNAILIAPKRPPGSNSIQFANLDDSRQKGMVASFKLDNEIRTIVLKKRNDRWYEDVEISSYGYDSLDFRDAADLTGEGKNQLLLGVSSGSEPPTLYAYSLSDGNATEMFAQNYESLDIMLPSKSKTTSAKARLAFWHKKDDNAYDIEVMRWNGSELVPVKNPASYYYMRVAPYYVRKIRQTPDDAALWYNLAETLSKAGAYEDALVAVNTGMRQKVDPSFKAKYIELRRSIIDEAHGS